MENEIYAACWFDGDKAVMMAGTRNSEGHVCPLAVERRPGLSPGSVANGVIALNEENRTMVSSLVQLVANRLNTTFADATYTVRGLYLGVMPRSMRGIRTSGEKVLDVRRYVNDKDIDDVRSEANAEASTFGEVLALYNNGFEIDGVATRHAKGELVKKVKINTLAVVVNKNFATDYKALMPKSSEVTLHDVVPAGVAVASAVTKSEERLDGVLSVHFCSSTTIFTVYRDDQVIATCVVPFGEEDVIHDMCCDSNLKQNSWKVMYDNWNFATGASNIMISDGTGKHPLDSKTVEQMNFAAESRVSEIYNIAIEWLCAQVQDFDKTIKHIVFTGRIADKLGFLDYVRESLLPGKDVECRCGDIKDVITDNKYLGDADYLPLVGLIKMASENCVERKTTQNVEELVGGQGVKQPGKDEDTYNPKQPSLFSKIGKVLANSLKEDNSL